MKNIWTWIKNNPIRFMFLIPIILVAIISISHVVSWYDLANPFTWAVYLSIAIEVGAMVALVAATNKIKGGVWFMFGLVTFIQMVGNIFFSFKEVDTDGYLFKAWIELTAPVWEVLGSDPTDLTAMKRWLAFLEGGLLPIISLTSLHFFVKFDDNKPKVETIEEVRTEGPNDDGDGGLTSDSASNPTYEITKEVHEFNEETGEVELPEEELPIETEVYIAETTTLPIVETFVTEEEYLDLQESHTPVNDTVNEPVNEPVNEGITEGITEGVNVYEEPIIETTETISDDLREIIETEMVTIDTGKIWQDVRRLKEEGKLPTPTIEDIQDEPTALSFTPYDVEEEIEEEVVERKTPEELGLTDEEESEEVQETFSKRLSYVKNNSINE